MRLTTTICGLKMTPQMGGGGIADGAPLRHNGRIAVGDICKVQEDMQISHYCQTGGTVRAAETLFQKLRYGDGVLYQYRQRDMR